MLEMFIMTICIKGSSVACENSSVAYYKQSGAETAISSKSTEIAQKNPLLAGAVGATSMIVYGNYIMNLGDGKYLTANPKQNIIGFKTSF
jgi:hypothetical protein